MSYYFPRYSIKSEAYREAWGHFAGRGILEKTVAGYDEDEVTMAVEAASGLSWHDEPGYLATATVTGPRLSTTLVTALGWEDVRKADFTGSTNASGEALLSCLDFVQARGGRALLVAADRPLGSPADRIEHRLGAAAVAVLISPDGGLEIADTATHTEEELGESFVDAGRRSRGLGVVEVASETVPKAVGKVLRKHPDRVKVACYEPDGRFARGALGGLVEVQQIGGNVVELSGDTGCSSPFLALMEAVSASRKGDVLLLVTYGGGSSVASILRVSARPRTPLSPRKALASGRIYLSYLQYAQFQRFLAVGDPPSESSMGAYLSVPSYLGSIRERYRLLATRCVECDHLQFPPRAVCLKCGERNFEREPLSGKGEVYARTVISRGSAPTEFREQQDLVGEYGVCLVQLEEGPRIITQMTDCEPHDLEIGMPVEVVFRRIYRQEGVVRHGYKFRPVSS